MNITLEQEAQNSESFRQNNTQKNNNIKAKTELLTQLDSEQKREANISGQTLIWTYILFFFILLFMLPKIYIANQIYYISKDINKQYHTYIALKEENRSLKKQLEAINYQNQVVNDIQLP